ncbi:MAG: hypothetical protein ABI790_06385 [Betaproteobacteria bacterium]
MSLPTPFETPEPGEAAKIAEMTDILRRKMERDYAVGSTLRDAHPKTLGLLCGTFQVEPGLPKELRVGVFKQSQRLDCWIRASNASGTVQSDAIPDARGFAIKLMAPGAKGSRDDASLGQDFVLMNSPVMPLGTIALFRDAVYFAIESSFLLLVAKLLLTGNVRVLLELLALGNNPGSPLDIRYWSTTPYRFGKDRAVKYSLLPTSAHSSRRQSRRGESYLGDAMQKHLQHHVATFDFCVQLRKDGMPIEDAGERWNETTSPFVKVATLQIPVQKFRSKKRESLAEVLSFSPGHALPAHVPLGGLNRARVAIYAALSAFRHQRDKRVDLA